MYSNEHDAYQRIWTNSIARQREEFAIIGKKSVLVMPDYLNNGDSLFDEYGYSFENGNLIDGVTGKQFNTLGTIHVHLNGSGQSGYMVNSFGDMGFGHSQTPGKPVFVFQNNALQEISFVISTASKPGEKIADIKWYEANLTKQVPRINGRSIRKEESLRQFIIRGELLAPFEKKK